MVEECQGLETQKWDFGIYPPGSPAKQEESTESTEKADETSVALAESDEDKPNLVLAEIVLEEVLKIYDQATEGGCRGYALDIHARVSPLRCFPCHSSAWFYVRFL